MIERIPTFKSTLVKKQVKKPDREKSVSSEESVLGSGLLYESESSESPSITSAEKQTLKQSHDADDSYDPIALHSSAKKRKLEDDSPKKVEDVSTVTLLKESQLSKSMLSKPSWEDDVKYVEHVCNSDISGQFAVTLRWNDNKRSTHLSITTNKKCPQKMIKFYEGIITFSE